MTRREFTPAQKRQIVERSKRDGAICCERCGQVLGAKPHEIDHIIPEALRPEVDKKAKLTIAEGQLLGKECCHRGENGKTKQDVKQIAKAKRQFDLAHGLKAPKQKIQSPGFPKRQSSDRPRIDKSAIRPLPKHKLFEARHD